MGLIGSEPVAPEQIVPQIERPTEAVLFDQWGRTHALDLATHVGRTVQGPTLLLLSSTVSRRQASIWHEDGAWILRDLGSANGTFVDEKAIETVALHDGARVRFGAIGFYFFADITGISIAEVAGDIGTTIIRAPSESEAFRATLDFIPPPLRDVVVEVHQPAGGGGGVVSFDGVQVQVTLAQLELLALLVERMRAEADEPAETCGFVSVDELLGKLSFESSDANENNVRQLVRRVRRLLSKSELGEMIESRPGRGYRLRVRPDRPAGTARR
ncbi:MAG: FHA domain-containing protein [Kofleriaceae bacterium]|nr:FHA domain-containing protein [Kofleriaceae bacterium]